MSELSRWVADFIGSSTAFGVWLLLLTAGAVLALALLVAMAERGGKDRPDSAPAFALPTLVLVVVAMILGAGYVILEQARALSKGGPSTLLELWNTGFNDVAVHETNALQAVGVAALWVLFSLVSSVLTVALLVTLLRSFAYSDSLLAIDLRNGLGHRDGRLEPRFVREFLAWGLPLLVLVILSFFFSSGMNSLATQPGSAIFPALVLSALLLVAASLWIGRRPAILAPVESQEPAAEDQVKAEALPTRPVWEAHMAAVASLGAEPSPLEPAGQGSSVPVDVPNPLELKGLVGALFGERERIPPPGVDVLRAVLGGTPLSAPLLLALPKGVGKTRIVALAAAARVRLSGRAALLIYPDRKRAETAWTLMSEALGPLGLPVHRPAGAGEERLADGLVVADMAWLDAELLPGHREKSLFIANLSVLVLEDLEQYSGIQACNVWAILRRLRRLLESHASSPQTIATISREPSRGVTGLEEYASRLLGQAPQLLSWQGRRSKEIWAYRPTPLAQQGVLDSYRRLPGQLILRSSQLVPTGTERRHIVPPDDQQALKDRGKDFAPRAASRAWLFPVTSENALEIIPSLHSLGERQGAQDVFACLLPDDNPFIQTMLRREQFNEWYRALSRAHARALVCTELNTTLAARHVRLALSEKEATAEELALAFGRHLELRQVLEGLRAAGALEQRTVYHLRTDGRVEPRVYYGAVAAGSVRAAARRGAGSLHTVGMNPISLRRRMTDGRDDVLMWIDPGRLAVDGYPGRIFGLEGRLWRVSPWSPALRDLLRQRPEGLSARDFPQGMILDCEQEGRFTASHRLPDREVRVLRPETESYMSHRFKTESAGLFVRRATVAFREQVRAVTFLRGGLADPAPQSSDPLPFAPYIETHALLLAFGVHRAPAQSALLPLAAAMETLLPLFLGIRAHDFAVCPVSLNVPQLRASTLGDGPAHPLGLAVVDYFEGGIGIIDGLSVALLETLLSLTLEWLNGCECQLAGCPMCIVPTHADERTRQSLDPAAAVALLTELLTPGSRPLSAPAKGGQARLVTGRRIVAEEDES